MDSRISFDLLEDCRRAKAEAITAARAGPQRCDEVGGVCEPEAKDLAKRGKLRQPMPRGGKRSTSFKPGQSGNPAGSSRKQWELRRRRRNTERAFVDAVAIQLEITTAAATELCRRGLVAPGHERDPQAVAHGVIEAAARYLGLKAPSDPGIPIIPRG
jgi:hypothetical protein